MEYQFDIIHILIGLFGCLLIINSILVIFSNKYFQFFSKVYFIEPASEGGKNNAIEKIKSEKNSQRYGLSIVSIILGLIAIHWSLGGHFSLFW